MRRVFGTPREIPCPADESAELRDDVSEVHRRLLTLVGFGDNGLSFSGFVDVADDIQILVN